MWYLIKIVSLCEQLSSISTCLQPQYKNFVFEIWEMVEKIKTDLNRLLLVNDNEKKIPIDFSKIELFLISQTKSYLSTFISIFSTISKILKIKLFIIQIAKTKLLWISQNSLITSVKINWFNSRKYCFHWLISEINWL